MKIGIIGYGVIGNALSKWLEENNSDAKVLISDPPKGVNDDISNCDAYFIQIHIPTEEDGTQNLNALINIINSLPIDKCIWIRTTILPGTTEKISKLTGRNVHHMPEFLSERTAIEDFKQQPMIFTGNVELLEKIFPGKKHIDMTSAEAEMVKYAHNVFGALKVTYFNCIYDICKKEGLDYQKVREGVLGSTYINDMHTQVPGPDGKYGYGGKCFPKDVDAFEKLYRDAPIGMLLNPVRVLNSIFRKG